MDSIWVLLRQNIIMALYMACGYYLYKKKMITKVGSGEMGKLLLYIVIPSVIIKAYMKDFSFQILIGLGVSIAAAIMSLLLSILVSRVMFRKYPIEHFGCAFSNAGFIGIPLTQALLGGEAVFYISPFVTFLNILQWTYGVYVITEDKASIQTKKIITNPVTIGFVVGIFLLFAPVQMPEVFNTVIEAVAGMNAPLAMIILGVYLAQLPLCEIFTGKPVICCVLLRLIGIPFLTMLMLSLLPVEYNVIKLTVLIAAAAPVGANVAIFAQMNGKDYTQAVKDICLSTMLCVITLPVIAGIANTLWK